MADLRVAQVPVTNDWGAIAVALVAIIGAISLAAVAVINAIGKTKKELLETQLRMHVENTARSDKQDRKAEEIHDLVNGSASAAARREEDLNQTVADMKVQISTLHQTVATLQSARVQDAKANGH